MSTISYKCDTCKREVELIENINGLTVFSKCVITDGCKGKLYSTGRNPDSIRESLSLIDTELNDYTPRRVFFEYKQNIISNTWKIQHDMSVFPAVTVYFDNVEVAPDDYTINIVNNNYLEIIFPQPQEGIVHLVARSSVPLKPQTVDIPEELFQVSLNGVLTFAVPKTITHGGFISLPYDLNDQTVNVEICLAVPDKEEVVCFESLPPTLSSDSPWVTWDEILVRNRRNYYPRSKDILDFNVFEDTTLTLDDIKDGTLLSFKRIDYGDGIYNDLESRGLFLLLSNYPHSSIDKVLNRLIDVGELIHESPNFLIFKEGEFHIDLNILERVYPDISKIKDNVYNYVPASPTPTPTVTATPIVTPTMTPSVTPTVTPTVTSSIAVAPLSVVVSGTSSDFCESIIEIDIDFSADVTGFVLGDITITDSQGAMYPANLGQNTPSSYTLDFTTNDATEITIQVPSMVVQDGSMNDNQASNVHNLSVSC